MGTILYVHALRGKKIFFLIQTLSKENEVGFLLTYTSVNSSPLPPDYKDNFNCKRSIPQLWTQIYYQRPEKEQEFSYLWSRKFRHVYKSLSSNWRDRGMLFHQYFLKQKVRPHTQSCQIWETSWLFWIKPSDSLPFKPLNCPTDRLLFPASLKSRAMAFIYLLLLFLLFFIFCVLKKLGNKKSASPSSLRRSCFPAVRFGNSLP